jgi:signal transduction histidine kinase
MTTILLLIDQKENRRILADWLTARYQVLMPEDSSLGSLETLNSAFDLCILDGTALHRLWDWVRSRKASEGVVFLPFLLITPRQDVNLATRYLWQGVDELLLAPVEKLELQARLEILLRARQLSCSLQAANLQLKDLNQLKTQFISIASHEFRNPLNMISGSASVLERSATTLTQERSTQLFDFIKKAVKKMVALLDDVLVVTRGELTEQKLNSVWLDLEALCQQITQEIQVADANYHTIEFTCDGDWQNVPVDEKLLRHILINLLSNAIKYSPPGSVVSFTLTCIDQTAVFSIQDQGIGIPEADQARLFEPFYRASNVKEVSGTGLGLAIVKQAVERHNGTIQVSSHVNRGTTFTIEIPLEMPNEASGDQFLETGERGTILPFSPLD